MHFYNPAEKEVLVLVSRAIEGHLRLLIALLSSTMHQISVVDHDDDTGDAEIYLAWDSLPGVPLLTRLSALRVL